jgi:hypothetical protein
VTRWTPGPVWTCTLVIYKGGVLLIFLKWTIQHTALPVQFVATRNLFLTKDLQELVGTIENIQAELVFQRSCNYTSVDGTFLAESVVKGRGAYRNLVGEA